VAAAAEAAAIANELGIADLQLEAEAARGSLHWDARDFADVLESIRRQLRLLPQIESASDRSSLLSEAAEFVMLVAGDYEEGLRLAREAHREAKGLSAHELMHSTADALEATYRLGRWDEADAFVREHLEAFRDEADRTCGSVMSGPPYAALLAAHRGDTARARELLALVGVDTSRGEAEHDREVRPAWVSGRVLVAIGEPEAARALSERYFATNTDSVRIPMALLESLVALGDWDALEMWLPKVRAVAAGNVEIGPAADRAEGHLLLARGDRGRAEAAFRRALTDYERLGLVFEAALTREAIAGLVDADEARMLRDSALEVFDRLGAHPHAHRVRDTLGAPGRHQPA
jgi:tetratricopeptide (TPR) repeat protein